MILVVGDSMLDVYDHVQSTRKAPESPSTPVVTSLNDMHMRPGGCLNVAECIRALGEEVTVFTTYGADQTGKELQRLTDHLDVEWFGGVGETTCKTRIMMNGTMLLRYDVDRGEEFEFVLKGMEAEVIGMLESGQVKCLVLSDYGKGVLAQPQEMIKAARRLKIPVIVDPKGKSWSKKYAGVNIVKPNINELPYNRPEAEYTVGTCGSQGMMVEDIRIPGIERNTIDPTGAGDQVIAALAVFYGVKGCTVPHAARIANVIASKSTEYEGVRPITMEETREECRRFHVAVPV